MPRSVPISLRAAGLTEETTDTPVVLVEINHEAIMAELGKPLRLSSDNTTVFDEDPYTVGTESDGKQWYFVLMEFIFPDDRREAPPSVQIAFENVEKDMTKLVRAITTPAEMTLYLTTAAAPDVVEERYSGLTTVKASWDESRITLDMSREDFTSEPWPSRRITKLAFPGLFL